VAHTSDTWRSSVARAAAWSSGARPSKAATSTPGCTVDGQVVHVEAEDAVERGERFVLEALEQAGCDPFVAAGAKGGVGDLVVEDRFDVDPGRSGDEADQQPPEAQPISTLGR